MKFFYFKIEVICNSKQFRTTLSLQICITLFEKLLFLGQKLYCDRDVYSAVSNVFVRKNDGWILTGKN